MRAIAAAAILCVTLTGCRTVSVQSVAYSPDKPNVGLVYALPMTKLKVTVVYTVEETTTFDAGIPGKPVRTVTVKKPVKVEPVTVGDPRNTFVLSGDGLVRDVRLDSAFKFGVTDGQLLASVTAEMTDKTAEALQGLVGSVVSVAKSAVAGAAPASPLAEIQHRLKEIDTEVARLAKAGPVKAAALESLVNEQKGLLAFAARYREANSEKTEARDVTWVKTVGLREMEWDGAAWRYRLKAPGKLLGEMIADATVPELRLSVAGTTEARANVEQRFVPSNGAPDGVYHRHPVALRTTVSLPSEDVALLDQLVGFSDASPVNVLPARYKAFAKRKTTIAFSPATGAVKEYGVDATSSMEATAKALDASAAKVQAGLGELRKAEAAAAAAEKSPSEEKLADLEMKRRLLEMEAAVLKAEKELERLRGD